MPLITKPIVWTIAASDSGGGAGIQADVKTFFDLGVHGCSAITAITAQNTQGVFSVEAMSCELLKKQLQVLAEDLLPTAIKVGVLPNAGSIDVLIDMLNVLPHCTVVLDTVFSPTLGESFSNHSTQQALKKLFPYIDVLTPNIPEAEVLTGITIIDTNSQQKAAEVLLAMGVKSVLLKGGHSSSDYCQDYFLSASHSFWLTQGKQDTIHTHGTGCTLSSAITAFIAQDKSLHDAVVLANAYVSKGIRLAQSLTHDNHKKGCVVQSGWPNNWADFPQVSLSAHSTNHLPMPICDTNKLGLYPVVDSIEWLEKLLVIGIKTIQLRVKDIDGKALNSMIQQAADLGRQYQARLFINDYWQLAIKYRAYGVHLGQEDMLDADIDAIRDAGLHLGISTHGEYEFSYAATFKPSYLAIGAIFPTDTKEVVEVGIDNLYQWAGILNDHFPLVAIGGINKSNIDSVLISGVGSIAVVSAITRADNYISATAELTEKIDR